jgi:hypothetical protein
MVALLMFSLAAIWDVKLLDLINENQNFIYLERIYNGISQECWAL